MIFRPCPHIEKGWCEYCGREIGETYKATASYNSDFDYEKYKARKAIKFWFITGLVLFILFIWALIKVS